MQIYKITTFTFNTEIQFYIHNKNFNDEDLRKIKLEYSERKVYFENPHKYFVTKRNDQYYHRNKKSLK